MTLDKRGKPLRVLHIGEYVSGGVGTYLQNLLACDGGGTIENYLICSREKSEHDWPIPEERQRYYEYKRSLCCLPRAMLSIRSYISEVAPDIIYAHSTWAGLLARLPMLIRKPHCKVIYNAHGWSFLMDTAEWKKKIYALVERVLALRTDSIIVVSDYEKQAALRRGFSGAKLKLIRSGIPKQRIESAELPRLSEACVNLLFCGRFSPPKGVDLLLRAMKKCPRDDIHLYVIGSGDGSAKATLVEEKDTPNVTFLGWLPREKVAAYYQACDAVIMPSRWEAFGLVAIEAMKYGKPVLASNRGALSELIEDGINGRIFDLDEEDGLINLLQGLKKDDLATMGEAAEKIFVGKYTDSHMLEKTLAIYTAADKEQSMKHITGNDLTNVKTGG